MIHRPVTIAHAPIIVASAVLGCIKKAKPSVDSFEWSSELRKEIVTVVSDEARAEQMLLVFKMKDLMTEEEWTTIFAPPKSEKTGGG